MPDVLMPRLSEALEEGTVLRWLKAEGDEVVAGEDLVEIEADKATETQTAAEPGVLAIVAAAGQTLPVGAVIGRLEPPAVVAAAQGGATVRPATGARGDVTVLELTRAQSALVRRVAESRATIPDWTARVEVDAGALLALRAGGDAGEATLGDLVVKACGVALREHPRLNGAYRDGQVELHARVNVGVAVALDDGLATPTIFDADEAPLAQLAAATRTLAARARAGELTAAESAAATFTVSNLGMHGIDGFGAVITPGQAAVLAVGAVRERAVARDGEVVVRPVLELALTSDHRIVLGVPAARFLARLRGLLEAPAGLL